tara:strand:+ start:30 stop:1520 length:1491 start_codon:yes stop_codon:yes gene_type:complete
MSFFRFLDKIPTIFFTIIWILLLGVIILGAPYVFIEDINLLITTKDNELVSNFSEFINPHLIFLNIVSKLTNFFELNSYFLYRLPNFIYLGLLILITYKIIKLKFYDLNYSMPLTAVMLNGTILISMTTIDSSLISGLMNLLILYFLLKIFEKENFLDVFLFILFSLIALILNNFYFVIIITSLILFKLFNLKLEKKKRLNLISYLCLIYILLLIFIVIQGINKTEYYSIINFETNIFIKKIFKSVIFLLPLLSLLIISIFYNVVKRINWNKDLITLLILIIISWFIFIFSNKLNLSILIFLLPIMSIYIFRTLEFVKLKWSKIVFISLFFIPAVIVYIDTSLYHNTSEIPQINYIFYFFIILASLINPAFSFQEKSLTAVYKIMTFSLILVVSFTSVLFLSQYNNKRLSPVIYDTLKNDYNCDIKKSEFILDENYPLDFMLFFSDKVKPDYFSECQIELKFSSLDIIPIEDSASINKTILDLTTKSYININFNKL